jgi:hypothetical protein
VRALKLFFAIILLCSTIAYAASLRYVQDGLVVERSLEIIPMNSINPSTGVIRKMQQTLITLTITNPGPADRSNVILEEDLTYLPSYVRLSFSKAPYESDGRTVRWKLPLLKAGSSVSYNITLPVAIQESAIYSALSPSVRADKVYAILDAPTQVYLGQNVALALKLADGRPVAGAVIDVIGPDLIKFSLVTDEDGRAFFAANQSGFYTYSIANFAFKSIPTTKSIEPSLPPIKSAGAIVPAETQIQPPSADFGIFWPILGGILLVGFAALGVFIYFSKIQEPAQGPASPASSSSASPSAALPASSTGMPASENLQESRDLSQSMAANYSPDLSSSAQASSSQPSAQGSLGDPEIIRKQTRNLLASRRMQPGLVPSMPGVLQPSNLAQEPLEPKGEGFSEQTVVAKLQIEENEVKESKAEEEGQEDGKEQMQEEGKDDADDLGSFSFEASPPSWIVRPSSLPPESVEVDDEAIAKTIAELELLRKRLRERSKKHSDSASVQAEAVGKEEFLGKDDLEDNLDNSPDAEDADNASQSIQELKEKKEIGENEGEGSDRNEEDEAEDENKTHQQKLEQQDNSFESHLDELSKEEEEELEAILSSKPSQLQQQADQSMHQEGMQEESKEEEKEKKEEKEEKEEKAGIEGKKIKESAKKPKSKKAKQILAKDKIAKSKIKAKAKPAKAKKSKR